MAVPAITNNSPAPGQISWDLFHIQYEGVGYEIPAGSTADRWVWWNYNDGNPIVESGADIPSDMTDDDLLLFGNKDGIGVRIQSTNLIDGEMIIDGSILAEAIAANQINSEHIITQGLDAGVIKFGVMHGDRIEVDTLSGDRIIADTIEGDRIIANTLEGDRVIANTLQGDRVIANTLEGDRVIANTLQGDRIIANTLNGDRVIANTLEGDRIIANTLDADRIIANSITAVQLASVLVLGNIITTRAVDPDTAKPFGPGVDLTPDGMTLYDAAGAPLVEMPNKGKAIWRGEAYISALTVETLTTLQQTLLAQASTFTMTNAISDPTNALSIQTSFVTESYGATPDGSAWTSRYGWAHDGKSHAFTLRKGSGGAYFFERWGTQSGSRNRVNNVPFDYFVSDANLGAVYNVQADSSCDLLVIYRITGDPSNAWWAGTWHWDASNGDFFLDEETQLSGVNTDILPAGTFDVAANKIRVAYSEKAGGQLAFRSWTPGNAASDPRVLTSLVFPYQLSSLLYGSFDLGTPRYIVASRSTNGGDVYRVFSTTGIEQDGEEWERSLPTPTCNGLTWNPTTSRFLALSEGIVQNYEAGGNSWIAPSDATWYAAYSWSNGTAETKMTAPQSFTMRKRARLTLIAPNRPAGVTEARFYLWKGLVVPSNGTVSMVRQGVSSATPPSLVVTNANFTGAKNNATANGFGSGTPAEIRSQAADASGPMISLKGNGSGRLGPLEWDSSGTVTKQFTPEGYDPGKFRCGSAAKATTTSSVTIAITFDPPMDGVPMVTATPSAGTQMYMANVGSKSAGGFTGIMVQRANVAVNATVGFDWIAMVP